MGEETDANRSGITALNTSPSPEPFNDGMYLGSAVNAITSELLSTPFIESTVKPMDVVSTDAMGGFQMKFIYSAKQLKDVIDVGSSSSLTIPLYALDLKLGAGFKFFQEQETSGQSMLILLTWERRFPSKRVAEGAELSSDAKQILESMPDTFRDHFGDYFVYQVSYKTRIVAMWKCTASSTSSLHSFGTNVKASAQLPGSVGGSLSIDTSIQSQAKANDVSTEVDFEHFGDASDVEFKVNDIGQTFESFCAKCKPHPSSVILRHYSQIVRTVPVTINMEPDIFDRLCNVFSDVRSAVMLNAMAPDSRNARTERQNLIDKIYRTIHAKRMSFSNNPKVLDSPILEIKKILDKLRLLHKRQDLLDSILSKPYEEYQDDLNAVDLSGSSSMFHRHPQGSSGKGGREWVKSTEGKSYFVVGRTQFSEEEKKAIGLQTHDLEDVKADWSYFSHKESNRTFPGRSDHYGTIVGFVVHDKKGNGKNGYWRLPKRNPIGTKNVSIDFRSLERDGFHWGMSVTFIPEESFDE